MLLFRSSAARSVHSGPNNQEKLRGGDEFVASQHWLLFNYEKQESDSVSQRRVCGPQATRAAAAGQQACVKAAVSG